MRASSGLALALFAVPWSSRASDTRPIHAAYVYKLAKHVRGPPELLDASSEFTICVLGSDPVMTDYLRGMVHRGFRPQSRPLAVLELDSFGGNEGCQVLWIPPAYLDHFDELWSRSCGQPLLFVTEGRDSGASGVHVYLFTDGDRVRFGVNPDELHRSGLSVGSQILELAERSETAHEVQSSREGRECLPAAGRTGGDRLRIAPEPIITCWDATPTSELLGRALITHFAARSPDHPGMIEGALPLDGTSAERVLRSGADVAILESIRLDSSPEVQALSLPFLFSDVESATTALDDLRPLLGQHLVDEGLELIALTRPRFTRLCGSALPESTTELSSFRIAHARLDPVTRLAGTTRLYEPVPARWSGVRRDLDVGRVDLIETSATDALHRRLTPHLERCHPEPFRIRFEAVVWVHESIARLKPEWIRDLRTALVDFTEAESRTLADRERRAEDELGALWPVTRTPASSHLRVAAADLHEDGVDELYPGALLDRVLAVRDRRGLAERQADGLPAATAPVTWTSHPSLVSTSGAGFGILFAIFGLMILLVLGRRWAFRDR